MSSLAQDPGRRQTDAGARDAVSVLIADDHRSFRDALADLVCATPGFVLASQASSGEEAVDAVEAVVPDLVLMDVVMPGMGGVAAAQSILSRQPNVVVVVISVDDPALDAAASTLGDAVGYARKQDLRPEQLKLLWESYGKSVPGAPKVMQSSTRERSPDLR
jgi:DNA-binding NarL/FixJ family response regulator